MTISAHDHMAECNYTVHNALLCKVDLETVCFLVCPYVCYVLNERCPTYMDMRVKYACGYLPYSQMEITVLMLTELQNSKLNQLCGGLLA